MVLPGQAHLIIQRGRRGHDVFVDERDRAVYLASLRDAAREAGVAVHAYGLFAHEVRLLATPRDEAGLAQMMQAVGRRFVRAFNQRHGGSGTPWEGRFRSAVIEAQRHFLGSLRFVEGLSEPAGPRAAPTSADATSSSAAHHLEGREDPIVEAHPEYWKLGNTPFEREARYRDHVAQPASAPELAAILRAALNGWVLGSEAFAAQAATRSGRRPRPSAPGRPRKSI